MARRDIPKIPQKAHTEYPKILTPGDLSLSNEEKKLVHRMLLEIIEGMYEEREKGLGPGLAYKIAEDMRNKSVVDEVMRQLRFRGWKSEWRYDDLVISPL